MRPETHKSCPLFSPSFPKAIDFSYTMGQYVGTNLLDRKQQGVMSLTKHLFFLHFDIVHGCQLRCIACPNSTLESKIQMVTVEDFGRCLSNIDVERIHT